MNQTVTPLAARRSGPLRGRARVPGDKSISHRALMLGALAVGRTEIQGLLEGEDVLATAAALRLMGADIVREADGHWRVDGVGVGGLAEPEDVIDLGNSGTSARLLLGILATHPFTAFVTGDASLRRRPMRRVIDPLSRFGAQFLAREGGRLRNDASPVTKAVNGWVARMPRRRRAEVPELPRSITSSGSARPPTPTPSTSQWPSPRRSMAEIGRAHV